MENIDNFLTEWNNGSDCMLVRTSGSTGKPKPVYVEKRRMEASAKMTCSFLGLKPGDTALLCLPLEYIAGKMMMVRSLVCNLKLVSVKPSGRPLAGLAVAPVFAAMTPTQVYNSLQNDKERELLAKIKKIIIGGASVDSTLAAALRDFPNDIWSTYGMTETLSHIALRRLSGSSADTWYTPFDNVYLGKSKDGCLIINAPSVCSNTLYTNDLVEFDNDGVRFRILGRKDNIIDCGGIKTSIEEIEKALCGCLTVPYMVTKRADRRWGEIIVLLAVTDNMEDVKEACSRVLPKYWQPKAYLRLQALPYTETGKPARKKAMEIAGSASIV